MKIFILADMAAAHTKKWINSLLNNNIDVYVFGMTNFSIEEYPLLPNDHFFVEDMGTELSVKGDGNFSKVKYLTALPKIKKLLKQIKPDILHSYYASSYGLLGALTGFRPFVVSVWGSDVYNFPNISFIHRAVLKYTLNKANLLFSTSNVMAEEIRKYSNNKIEVVPFGIDTSIFYENKVRNIFSADDFVIGTIKKIEKNYAIDVLIKAFKLLKDRYPKNPLKLLIVGGGIEENNLKSLVNSLGISHDVVFTGLVPYKDIAKYHNEIDVAAYLSIKESFGVSILESSACGVPVVVSEALGFKEIVKDNVTGIIVETNNVQQTFLAIERLMNDPILRDKLTRHAKQNVKESFELKKNILQTIDFYKSILKK